MKKSIFNYTKEELTAETKNLGMEKFRAKQIWGWVYDKGVVNFAEMSNIKKDFQQKLSDNLTLQRPEIDNLN